MNRISTTTAKLDQFQTEFSVFSGLSDFVLLNLAFFSMQFVQKQTILLSKENLPVLFTFYVGWVIISIFTEKFHLISYETFDAALILCFKSNVFLLYFVASCVVFLPIEGVSLAFIAGSLLILMALELTGFSLAHLKIKNRSVLHRLQHANTGRRKCNLSVPLIALDFVLLTTSFVFIEYFRVGHIVGTLQCQKLLLLFYGLWFPSSLFTRKFNRRTYSNVYHALTPSIKAAMFTGMMLFWLVYSFKLVEISAMQTYGTLLLFVVSELVLNSFFYLLVWSDRENADVETVDAVEAYLRNEQTPLEISSEDEKSDFILSAKHDLENNYLTANPRLFNFINKNINLDVYDIAQTTVFNSTNLNHLNEIDHASLKMFVNLKRLNDVRWINKYFLEVYKRLRTGGTLVGICDTIDIHKRKFLAGQPKYVAKFLYACHFVYARILPKLPYLKKIYFLISRGKNRMLSKAEVLGRLYFCGYKVIAVEEKDDHFYVIAKKVKTPSTNKNPSYGPIIKMRRIGLNGRPIYINKLRTMHPYSENLQEYVFEQNALQANGKFQNDFRVTGWAKVLRKLWLDELPQLINYFQGDLNLVGVRALSQQYFQLYPKELQQLRVQFKPGLIPPYYADLPTSLEEIIASEKRYLLQKLQRPLLTDLKYLVAALYNIMFKGARSR